MHAISREELQQSKSVNELVLVLLVFRALLYQLPCLQTNRGKALRNCFVRSPSEAHGSNLIDLFGFGINNSHGIQLAVQILIHKNAMQIGGQVFAYMAISNHDLERQQFITPIQELQRCKLANCRELGDRCDWYLTELGVQQ